MDEESKGKLVDLLDRLVSTTQDAFIFQALEAGVSVRQITSMVRVNTDRVTRISKLRPKQTKVKDAN